VLENVLANGKSGGEKIGILRKGIAALLEKLHIIVALLRVFRVFPVNYYHQ
jgi:hypothetical protein